MEPSPDNVAELRAAMREYAFGEDLDAEWAFDQQEHEYFAREIDDLVEVEEPE